MAKIIAFIARARQNAMEVKKKTHKLWIMLPEELSQFIWRELNDGWRLWMWFFNTSKS